MSDKEEKGKSGIAKREEGHVTLTPEKSMIIGKGIPLDLTGIPEDQIQSLKYKYAERMGEIAAKAMEAGVDTETLDKKLATIAGHTIALTKEGASVTITSTSDDSIGRTEAMIGNTETAKIGKLSRSQAGLKDLYPFWIGVGLFIIIVILVVVKMR